MSAAIPRVVAVGGLTKPELLRELERNAISMNESAARLFASEQFTTDATRASMPIVELAVRELDLPHGALTAEIFASARARGLDLCPLELGPHLRLQYLDQPEGARGQPLRRHRAPSGALTIASEPLSADDDFPKGFYLRRIDGVLWLRGYLCDAEHLWDADDRFVFRDRRVALP